MTSSSESEQSNTVSLSVVIPTWCRTEDLCRTLRFLKLCRPLADELIVHADAGDEETPAMLEAEFPEVRVIQSQTRQGPGGGRNKLIRAARHDVILSLDDDSWPMQADFLGHAVRLMDQHSRAGVISCLILETDGDLQNLHPPGGAADDPQVTAAGGFVGCGAIVRRSAFLQTSGYLPLARAYGMEEADLALQLMAEEWQLLHTSQLRVFHACDRSSHHASPEINAAQIRNTALLAFLRYPVTLWPRGILQTLNRIIYSVKKRRFRGMLSGLCSIVPSAVKYRKYRAAVPHAVVDEVKRLQRLTAESQTP